MSRCLIVAWFRFMKNMVREAWTCLETYPLAWYSFLSHTLNISSCTFVWHFSDSSCNDTIDDPIEFLPHQSHARACLSFPISKYVHRPGQHCNIHGIFSNPNFPLSKLPVLKLDLLRLCFSGHLQVRKAWQSFVNSTFHCLNYLPSLLIPSCARNTC